jgi:hypothetical protein
MKKKTRNFRTQHEIAAACGVTQQAVSRWIRDPQWKSSGLSKSGPWPIDRVKKFQSQFRSYDAAVDGTDPFSEIRGLSPLNRAKLADIVDRTVDRKMRRELDLGLLIKKKDHERRMLDHHTTIAYQLRQIGQLSTRLPLAPEDIPRAEKILVDWMKSIFRKIETGQMDDPDEPQPEAENAPAS